MELIKISELPKQLEWIDKNSIDSNLTLLENKLKILLDESNREIKNVNKSINRCLLLLNFLKGNFSEFESLLEKFRASEVKIGEREHLYYDLVLLQPNNKKHRNTIIEKIEYEKLLKSYLKWQLLFKNLVIIRYEAQINQIEKSNWLIQPSGLVNLLELLVDWIFRLSNKSQFLELINGRINYKNEQTQKILEINQIQITDKSIPFTRVKLAVWDTGIDSAHIKNISPNLSLYYDSKCNVTETPLVPLDNISKNDFELYKGFLDLKIAKESRASNYLIEEVSKYDKEGMIKFKNVLNQLSVYSHGTSVAKVASRDNPNIEIIPIRVTFDSNQSFPTMYTVERIEREIKMHEKVFAWIQENGIRVVNMSWNHRKKDLKISLQNTGHDNSEVLDKLVNDLFDSLSVSLYNGIQVCTDTLFVVGAGNSNSIVEEEGFIPSSFSLPNLIVVGAVNYKLERTAFTTIGKSIDVYANGSYIPTIIPGGYDVSASGTSLSAPQVSNLAGTILTINPSLGAESVKKHILKNADSQNKEGIQIINPQKTIDSVLSKSKLN